MYSDGRSWYTELELLDVKENEKVTFDKIVMLVNGKKSSVGQPYVKNATVVGTVLKHDKTKKVIVFYIANHFLYHKILAIN